MLGGLAILAAVAALAVLRLTPSKRHMNWTPVVWTPPSPGTATTLKGVTNVEVDHQGSVIKHSGDNDHYVTTLINDFEDPQITISHRDLSAAYALTIGQRGSLEATHLDAKNGATVASGGYKLTMAAGMIMNRTQSGQHRQFGEGRIIVCGESTDGVTNPLAFAAL